ncbi:MAG: type II toxin-antitoxin system VapC family toxin [Candidatus Bathyarchaeota archaeon]
MTLLFDASALLNTIRLYGNEAYKLLKGSLTLSLTRYEVGNALWKETVLLKRINFEEALEAIFMLDKVLKIMVIVEPSSSDVIFKLAHSLQLTYYDASYIFTASEKNAKLVTDDTKLTRKIQENINTIVKILGREVEASSSDKI